MADFILIQDSLREYQPALTRADRAGNGNKKVDTKDEARAAAEEYCRNKHEGNCRLFLDYLERSGLSLGTQRLRLISEKQKSRLNLRRQIAINNNEIIFPKGYLPREGAYVVIRGQQSAYVQGDTTRSFIRPSEVTFVVDGSGSMRNRFPKSTLSKFDELGRSIDTLLGLLPEHLWPGRFHSRQADSPQNGSDSQQF